MARELFYEESVSSARAKSESALYNIFLIAGIICFAIAGITAFFATAVIPTVLSDPGITDSLRVLSVVQWLLTIAGFAGVGVLFWWIKRRFNISYDYTFVEDELRITKVFNGKKRSLFAVLHADQILKIGWCEKPSYEATLRGLRGKPKIVTPNKFPADGKEFVYILTTSSLEKAVYVLECRREMLEYLVRAAGVQKLERE